eukprot:767594-Hanusia_phi.AAC.19
MPWEASTENDKSGVDDQETKNPFSIAETLQSMSSKYTTPAPLSSLAQGLPTMNLVEHEVAIEQGSGIVQLEKVNITTGEENENTLFSAEQVKLYEFQKEETDQNAAGSWKSRGIGILRLKQSRDGEASKRRTRVIVRQTGNLAVLVNSALFPGMACNKG